MKRGTSGGECYGTYSSTTGTGSGGGYTNACIHSDSSSYAGGNTVWYNYATASAGTITGTNNTTISTENVCPKGWSLPTEKQTSNNTDIDIFSPVLGENYNNGVLNNEATYGFWWNSTAYNDGRRYALNYNNSSLYTESGNRYGGRYIRCVSEEKDVSDLTYMQDMTKAGQKA